MKLSRAEVITTRFQVSVAYDLVIIASTDLGRQIALKAAGLKARIALVEIARPAEHWLGMAAIYQPIKRAIAPEVSSRWLQTVLTHLDELDSPAVLAALGIDIIQEAGEFCLLPRFGFAVKNRLLTARNYLIIPTNRTIFPDIAGIERLDIYTRENLGEKIVNLAPQRRWVVIGGNATGVEFAQILHRLGARVTLVVKGDRILPQEDADIANLLQARLEAEGIEILTRSPVELIRQIDRTKWVQAGNRAIETDEIFLSVRQYPQIEHLNLEGVRVQIDRRGIKVNSKLQTTNPRIYSCSSHQQSIAAKEADTALHNALFFPTKTVNYERIPVIVSTQPPLARIGLTPDQAQSLYGDKVLVLREYFKHLAVAQIASDLTGMCQVIVRSNGEIIGAQILGERSAELVEAIAMQMQHGDKIRDLAKCAAIYPRYSEIFSRLEQAWLETSFSHQKWQAECLDKFFDWRRSWTK